MKMVIADGSARLRNQLVEMLCEFSGLEIVGQAQDATEVLRAIRELCPDLLTLEVCLNGGSGIAVLKKIRQRGPVPVVIMLTNDASPPYRKKCLEAGADFFLDKSTELKILMGIVSESLLRFDDRAPGT